MVDLFLYNNPNVILPLKTRLAINRLGLGRNQKKWHYQGKKAGRNVKERCAKHNKNRHELIPLVSRRHQAQKTGFPILIGFQNVRSLNNKVEDVVELIQDYKMNVMFMAETWHDLESISTSKLRSGSCGLRESKAKSFRVSEDPVHQPWKSGSGFQLHVPGNVVKVNFNCQF